MQILRFAQDDRPWFFHTLRVRGREAAGLMKSGLIQSVLVRFSVAQCK